MFNISNNQIITITRGDTASFTITINLGTELCPIIYDLLENDKVYFGIMEPNCPFEHAIVKKVFGSDDFVRVDPETGEEAHYLQVTFKSEDTEFLLPGNYYYMIKLFRPANPLDIKDVDKIDTIVTKHKFVILD